jgi:DNA polymerase-3 subunit epsilon
MLNLIRPLVFFDLETTGVSITQDRIVQIGAVKLNPDGTQEEKNVLVNPTIPIPEEASEVHGIKDEDVKNAPVFKQIAKSLFDWLYNCDIAGYNSNSYDIPLLAEEFGRLNIDWPMSDTKCLDMLKIERLLNPNTLEAAYKRYTGLELEGAHDALADVKGTIAVLEGQLKSSDIENDIAKIEEFQRDGQELVDMAGKLAKNEKGEIIYAIGKDAGLVVKDNPGFGQWMLGKDFPRDTKRILRGLFNG